MSDDRIPMTREGYDKLKAEVDRLAGPEMIEITRRVAAARDLGDLSENAEYHAAREDQGMLQAKINSLRDRLNRAYIVDQDTLPKDVVVFGCTVKVRDLDEHEEEEFQLVSDGMEDASNNKILVNSPIGQGLLGRKVGDQVEITVPRGTLRFKILEISFD
ncbi:transcription elongation factor GreA [Tuwongella immobilis]|uniref:Transcription elongation factor GreA n=1 Tax=Tuwongella immobilis TaxID=692036 RepID=A0A6C2YMI0_9BACT|nr:transcription elongation factor GreA [Tuwongella immobilis]VIP02574.1 transcription elongation factor : Transcription elongation factor GreA OS=Rhodopirellula baltica SWK14 GN=greA PE=3 SV=1: GreA_GreB_N: GreA_GreB [Tuwongella immobilis]VTS01811.1 transcription elongation factor : Transcription elongation factor GreA OS=Rhodopirellula baltica SWK14 GN=greA PE=3 SV=1: GreA_GreB_N: GreA_GreB [Tuwongella immobilis]